MPELRRFVFTSDVYYSIIKEFLDKLLSLRENYYPIAVNIFYIVSIIQVYES